MSKTPPSDTDLARELVDSFVENQKTLADLVARVTQLSNESTDPVVRVKLKELRGAILVEDVQHQTLKINLINKTLEAVCSTKTLQNV